MRRGFNASNASPGGRGLAQPTLQRIDRCVGPAAGQQEQSGAGPFAASGDLNSKNLASDGLTKRTVLDIRRCSPNKRAGAQLSGKGFYPTPFVRQLLPPAQIQIPGVDKGLRFQQEKKS